MEFTWVRENRRRSSHSGSACPEKERLCEGANHSSQNHEMMQSGSSLSDASQLLQPFRVKPLLKLVTKCEAFAETERIKECCDPECCDL